MSNIKGLIRNTSKKTFKHYVMIFIRKGYMQDGVKTRVNVKFSGQCERGDVLSVTRNMKAVRASLIIVCGLEIMIKILLYNLARRRILYKNFRNRYKINGTQKIVGKLLREEDYIKRRSSSNEKIVFYVD
ncbi:hypothetical protein PHYBLDRAFT_167465 [Phycomyces blakesleeanus NRRL 1555(-)]|uniref:Uncharacterized protein n=1 Tax=Phycomyces blakesleeanus (strain ATCC 8743b / DSM 1359 / FGSC 10004 / NBRC 33097 / NRRL 1555) TaxID=763407 RepID=A0A162PXK8_PHYB8|nr:hypothetical protein PHYBLDRAFT_167465 [Phycomyces blakesleeanus NRRL 1555(-)]OAD75146.1 hypothetical protein PHYBLDRAFT_167465 [Phycomyces blakesleeanus NRRL 1555(-)]|eukprot:XP_018293186.1 hypothetical protein PHYBLDRAFT_167465 [Phycomyces blakesleeanus NRRL 1555(-)]